MDVQKPDLLFMYAESPVHWGTGTSVGVVDLPIQRERHTDYPTGQSSGIKGALRDWFEKRPGCEATLIKAAFGPDTDASDHAGCVAFGDARLILFPVRSLRGTFAYCTSRLLLARLERDLALAGEWQPLVNKLPDNGKALVAEASPLIWNGRVVLEEYPVEAEVHTAVQMIGSKIGKLAAASTSTTFWPDRIGSHLCIVPEDIFRDLVKMATTIETHVRIDNETGTADEGGLFYEELLPSDSVLYCPLYIAPPLRPSKRKPDDWPEGSAAIGRIRGFIAQVNDQRVQMGAGATSGRGVVLCRSYPAGGSQ